MQALAKEAGFEAHAATWAIAFTKVEDVQARIVEAREIKALCTVVAKAGDADAYIKAGKTVAQVREDLVNKAAAADKHIDTARKQGSEQPQAGINVGNVFARRRGEKVGESAAPIVKDVYAKRKQISQGA